MRVNSEIPWNKMRLREFSASSNVNQALLMYDYFILEPETCTKLSETTLGFLY